MGRKMTHNEFLKKLKEKNPHYLNNDFKVISEYNGVYKGVIVISEYGQHEVQINSLMNGTLPNIESAINKEKYFENRSIEIHGNKYNYDLVKYVNSQSRIKIICPEHGEFEQLPNNHLQGKGCPQCRYDYNTFKLEDWKQMCPGNPGTFYILKCWNEDEEFYKIGITCQDSVEKRYCNIHKMPYSYEVVKEIIDFDRERIWNLEKEWLKLLKNYKYKPKIKFKGYLTECFKI